MNTIKKYIAQYDIVTGKLNKIKLTKYFVSYLISVYKFIIDYPTFNHAVIDKMNELQVEINDLYNNNQIDFILFDQVISNINHLLQIIKLFC